MENLTRSGYNLPHPLTSFVGRETELAEIKQLLNQYRFVTLTGTGGVGKTRLALQYAHLEARTNLVETYFVELAPLLSGQYLMEAVARVLSLKDLAGLPLIDGFVAFLKDRPVLLVLDNCEHVLEECARLCATLLSRCPTLKIMSTSRETFGIAGETALRVPSLTCPDPKLEVGTSRLIAYDAVRLFLDRVRAADLSFSLTEENSRAVAQICSRLDGIPLALELAAARTGTLPVELLADRLDNRFRLLAGGSRVALPRQQTLLAMVDWSYNLLADKEKILLRRLGLFAGALTVAAAENICSTPADAQSSRVEREEVLEILSQLVNKSLVQLEREGSCYRLLETIRYYAREKLDEASETEAFYRRYRDWYMQLAQTAAPLLTGPDQLVWRNRLVKERDNFRAALNWSLDQGELTEAVRLNLGLGYFWYSHGLGAEAIDWLEQIYSRNEQYPIPPDLLVKLYNELGQANHSFGRYSRAEFFHREAIRLWEKLGDKESLTRGLRDLGWCYWFQQKNEPAEQFAEKSLALAQQTNNIWSVAAALHLKGIIFCHSNRAVQALILVEQSLNLWRELDDLDSISSSLLLKGQVLIKLGRIAQAKPVLAEAIELHLGLSNLVGLEINLQEVARICARSSRQPSGARAGAQLMGFINSRFSDKNIMGPVPPAINKFRVVEITAELKKHLGEAGYVLEYTTGAILTQAEALKLAQYWLRPEESVRPYLQTENTNQLTNRELEVLQLVVKGYSNPEIADRLVLSRRTVEAHIRSIFNKLEVNSRAGAVRFAQDRKLV